MEGRQLSLWNKVVAERPDAAQGEQKPVANRDGSPSAHRIQSLRSDPAWRWKRRGLDVVGALFWAYAVTKLFIYDIDRALIEQLAPGADWILDLRFFFVLLIVAVAVMALRTRSLLIAALYVGLFPFVVILWKLPRWLIRLESWVTAFALMNVVTVAMTRLRYVVVAAVLALFAALGIIASDNDVLVGIAAVVVGVLLVTSFARTVYFSLKPSRFIQMQERGISKVLDSRLVASFTTVDEDLRSDDIEVFDEMQQQRFLFKVAFSAAAHRALYFWAYQLDRYRRSAVGVLYSALSYISLLLQAVVGLTFINVALYKIDPELFNFDTVPDAFVFARYSFASLTTTEIEALQAQGSVANAVSLVSMFVGIGLLLGLVLTVALTFRKEQQSEEIESSLERIGQRGQQLEERHRDVFEMPIQETMRRLEELAYGLRGMVTFFSSRIPPGWKPGHRP